MKKILIALWVLQIIALFMALVEFIALDTKITKAIDRQGQINGSLYELIKEQERTIRLIETDNEIAVRIVTNGDYIVEEDYEEY